MHSFQLAKHRLVISSCIFLRKSQEPLNKVSKRERELKSEGLLYVQNGKLYSVNFEGTSIVRFNQKFHLNKLASVKGTRHLRWRHCCFFIFKSVFELELFSPCWCRPVKQSSRNFFFPSFYLILNKRSLKNGNLNWLSLFFFIFPTVWSTLELTTCSGFLFRHILWCKKARQYQSY